MDITGSITGATATVDSCLKTTASGKITYIMFLNNVKSISNIFSAATILSISLSGFLPFLKNNSLYTSAIRLP